MDRLLLWVDKLEKAVQKHRHHGDVLTSPSELLGIVPRIDDVALNLAGTTPGTGRRVTRTGHIMVCLAHRHRWRLVLPPLS